MALGIENISTDLVGTTLGTSSRDVGTLCISDNVNPWSRCKPFIGMFGMTDIENPNSTWAINHSFTFDFPNQYDLSTLENCNWHYNAPTGLVNSPYRLGDFRKYDHAATPVIGTQYAPNYTKNIPSDDTLGMKLELGLHTTVRQGGGLKMSDFTSVLSTMGITDMYFGVYCFNETLNKHAIFKCAQTVGNGGYEVIIPTAWVVANGPAKAIMCLCTSNFGIDESYASPFTGAAFPLPHGYAITKITNSECTITIDKIASLSTIAVLKVIGISSSLNGTYSAIENYYSEDASTGYFTTGAGADVFFKCQLFIANPNGMTEATVSAADFVVTIFDGGANTYTLSGSAGDVYDTAKTQQAGQFTLATNSFFYIGRNNINIPVGDIVTETKFKFKGREDATGYLLLTVI